MSADHCDVLIVGGGMVGASLANALAGLGLDLALVEATPPRAPGQPSYDDRSTALSWGSHRIFATLGLWPKLRAAATPIRHIHVSERGRFGVTRLSHVEQQVEALGYVVENRALGEVLWSAMRPALSRLYCPARVCGVTPAADRIGVEIESEGRRILCEARLLVVADGARSVTRAALGIGVELTDYGQHAVIANVTPQRAHEYVAYERFTPTGPLALLPMSNGRCSVVWTVAPERAPALVEAPDERFLGELQDEFGHRLGPLRRVGHRHAYPLSLTRAARITGPRHALVGNAAHGLHPVAGQGFNLGLRDVATLAELIADSGADPGSAELLRRYAVWRRSDHDRVIGFTDGVVRVFTSGIAPVRAARDAGLLALDLFRAPRSMLARQSMGMSGRLPRLARGLPLR